MKVKMTFQTRVRKVEKIWNEEQEASNTSEHNSKASESKYLIVLLWNSNDFILHVLSGYDLFSAFFFIFWNYIFYIPFVYSEKWPSKIHKSSTTQRRLWKGSCSPRRSNKQKRLSKRQRCKSNLQLELHLLSSRASSFSWALPLTYKMDRRKFILNNYLMMKCGR